MATTPSSIEPFAGMRTDEEGCTDDMNRTPRMLIGYASRFGSTRDIAIRIAGTIRTHGNDVDVRSVDEIADFGRYDAVVFGSGVYDGSWTAEAFGVRLCSGVPRI